MRERERERGRETCGSIGLDVVVGGDGVWFWTGRTTRTVLSVLEGVPGVLANPRTARSLGNVPARARRLLRVLAPPKRGERRTRKTNPTKGNVHHADESQKRDTRGTNATHETREHVPCERRADPTSSQYARHNAIRREVLKKQQEAANGVHGKEEADAKA